MPASSLRDRQVLRTAKHADRARHKIVDNPPGPGYPDGTDPVPSVIRPRHRGAKHVVAVDSVPFKREKAVDFDATLAFVSALIRGVITDNKCRPS
jgi:hypothetical protein